MRRVAPRELPRSSLLLRARHRGGWSAIDCAGKYWGLSADFLGHWMPVVKGVLPLVAHCDFLFVAQIVPFNQRSPMRRRVHARHVIFVGIEPAPFHLLLESREAFRLVCFPAPFLSGVEHLHNGVFRRGFDWLPAMFAHPAA